MQRLLPFFVLSLSFLLQACGDGGGGGADETPKLRLACDYSGQSNVYATEDTNFELNISSLFINPNKAELDVTPIVMPQWLTYDSASMTFSGVPSNEESDQSFFLSVNVSDGQDAMSCTPPMVHVVSVNDAPVVQTTAIQLEGYQLVYEGDLVVEDQDNSQDSLTVSGYSITNPFMSVTFEGLHYTLTINENYVTTADQPLVIDGTVCDLEPKCVHFAVPISINSSAMNVTFSIENGDTIIANNGVDLQFTTSEPMDLLNYNEASLDCSSRKLMLSADDFATCLDFYIVAPNGDWRTFQVMPLGYWPLNASLKFKISKDIKSFIDTGLAEDAQVAFETRGGIVINEVGGTYYRDSMNWIEIYNSSSEAIDLSDFALRTRGVNSSACVNNACTVYQDHSFSLGNRIIYPGEYLLVRGQNQYGSANANSESTLFVQDGSIYPYWDWYGYAEIYNKSTNITHDYVAFGDWGNKSIVAPKSIPAWTTTAPGFDEPGYQQSIGRNQYSNDYTSRFDFWSLYAYNTPLSPNDVNCSEDTDEDGLPDCAENSGTFAGINLYEMGARVGVKDIFIEVDYMGGDDEALTPRREALQKVVDVFATHNIAIHFDAGDLFDNAEGINPDNFDLGGGSQVAYAQTVQFDVSNEYVSNFYDIKGLNFDYRRLPIFHYMLFANSQEVGGAAGSSGISEIYGNDILITLGGWDLNSATTADENALINLQAVTMMHELGHNLGLKHGGQDSVNYKPVYLSVMNYMYSIHGLPTTGVDNNARYYFYRNQLVSGSACAEETFANSVWDDYRNFKIDYSSSTSAIDESLVHDSVGINNGTTDWACNGIGSGSESVDVNFDGTRSLLSNSVVDWDNLELRFAREYSGTSNGSTLNYSAPETGVYDIPQLKNDRTDLVVEDKTHTMFQAGRKH